MAANKGRPADSKSVTSEDASMTDANDQSFGNGVPRPVPEEMDTPDYTDSDTNPNTTASSVMGDTPADGRKRRSEAFALRKSVFGKKHKTLDESKKEDTKRRFRYLIGLTDLFRHFIDASNNPDVRTAIAEIDEENKANAAKAKKGTERAGGASVDRRRRTEQEEDAELLRDERRGGEAETVFQKSPPFIKNGEMRDYQVMGLNWLVSLHENGISGILADEMGLGKTLQTIAFLGYLRHVCGITGPHLITVPKSTLDNWKREFAMWTPEVNVLVLQGQKEERHDLINERLVDEKFDVCITSYEMILREKSHLKKFAWEYIIIDEAHRIKNEESSLAQNMRLFNSRNRLLITGTPLQNNLHELWALLNFLLPDIFDDSKSFDTWFSGQSEDPDLVVKQLHKVLQPFLLRRVKSDVEKSLLPKKEVNLYIPMADMQVKWYKKILEKDIDAVNDAAGGKKESKTRLLNIVMQLRKCCNHPYLFEGAEPGPPYTTDEHLVQNAGKMVMLDKILDRMKRDGSRILIFSQMSRVLDILEDYCVFRGHNYCRIDGSTAHEDRIASIDEYNKPGSEKFVFLLTTRAGGLGINLTSADIVILYDSDWNPQADLQAMDRAHRIGQTKQVKVFRFVTEQAIEEKVLERAAQKLRLDQLVIQQGRAQQAAKAAASKAELVGMIQHGAADVFQTKGATGFLGQNAELTDDAIEEILRKGEQRTAELNAKYEKLGIDDLQNFSADNAYEWNGQDFTNRKKQGLGINWIEPAKRERKEQNYGIDKYYRQALTTGGRAADAKPKAPRAPKQITIQEFQFFPPTLLGLQDRETAYYRKEIGYKVPLPDNEDMSEAQKEDKRALEQREIDEAAPLTEEEQELKSQLSDQGFGNWNRRDFQQFINGSAKSGRKNWEGIALEVDSKTPKEIREYARVFWERYTEITDYQKYLATIEAGEDKARKIETQRRLLRRKMEMYRVPLQQLKLNYSVSTTNKKVYTEEEDRFILCMLDKYGVDEENVYENIRDAIRDSPLFRFDWFFLSRTPIEIGRRCATLLTTVAREFNDPSKDIDSDAPATNGVKHKGRQHDEDEEEDQPAKKKTKGAKNKQVAAVKDSRASTAQTSRATSELSTEPAGRSKGKGKKR